MRTVILLILLIFIQTIFSQNVSTVIYKHRSNGIDREDISPLMLVSADDLSRTSGTENNKYEEAFWFDYSKRKTYQSIRSKDGGIYITEESFDNYPKPEFTDETIDILGYICKKAKIVLRSNNIDIWYTLDAGFRGSPVIYAGHELGLVLKIVRNGNYEIYADKIDKGNTEITMPEFPAGGVIVDLPTYRDIATRNNYTSIKIFENERINFDESLPVQKEITNDVTYRYSKGTVILKKIRLPENMEGSIVFADLKVSSSGDAYDRTGSVFVIDSDNSFLNALKNGVDVLPEYKAGNGKSYRGIAATDSYTPPAELMRFITSFGIEHFNEQVKVKDIEWENKAVYKMDVTDMLPLIQGEVYIGIFIGNYDKGGHTASLTLNYHPGEAANKKLWIKPLVNTVIIMEMSGQEYGTLFESDTLMVRFNIPEGVKNVKLRYITTGHGGWENGDEFNQKVNYIFIDGKMIHSFIPWRSDCGSFREFNPASGNFPSGISSSDYSRSGWCPGTTVNPVDVLLADTKSGVHTLGIYIPLGKPEGTSFSAWNVSAVLIGEY